MAFTIEELGFARDGDGWRKAVGGLDARFRRLRSAAELEPVADLQQVIWGLTDRDVVPPHALMPVADTGGAVLGAWRAGRDELAGFVFGWGGYVDGRPILVSDMLGVHRELRHRGLGFALKGLQGALALAGGFVEMRWTVDPLRAANARLNFAKLGAYSDEYFPDLYGSAFGEGLYGGMPTDHLAIRWPLTSARARERLLGRRQAPTWADCAGLPVLNPGEAPRGERVLVELPADVDALLATDPPAALAWRHRLGAILPAAFAQGYAITEFVGNQSGEERRAYYLLERDWRPA